MNWAAIPLGVGRMFRLLRAKIVDRPEQHLGIAWRDPGATHKRHWLSPQAWKMELTSYLQTSQKRIGSFHP